jgi:hypothetical protein
MLPRDQTRVAADLLAAREPLHVPNREDKGQGGDGTHSGLGHQQTDRRIGFSYIGHSLAQQLDLSLQRG